MSQSVTFILLLLTLFGTDPKQCVLLCNNLTSLTEEFLCEKGFMRFKLVPPIKKPHPCLSSIARLLVGWECNARGQIFLVSSVIYIHLWKNNNFQALLLTEAQKISSGLATDGPQAH